ncbi:hypothetical protein [Amycolatopsis pigmentata]|uniref:Uncharacterized protein n=1 Tax=Amycolatopsis pigmentata TaxID=450801 RepID=A0ABW5FSA0_9PSEU
MMRHRAQFLPDLAMYIECRPNPCPGRRATLLRPGTRVTAPVYSGDDHTGYAPGTVVSCDEIDRMVTVAYDEPRCGESGFPVTGVIAYAISVSGWSPVDSMPRR